MEIAASRSHGLKLVSGAAMQRFAAGRVCEVDDCATRLSRYNAATCCSQHQGWEADVASPPPRPVRSPAGAISRATNDSAEITRAAESTGD